MGVEGSRCLEGGPRLVYKGTLGGPRPQTKCAYRLSGALRVARGTAVFKQGDCQLRKSRMAVRALGLSHAGGHAGMRNLHCMSFYPALHCMPFSVSALEGSSAESHHAALGKACASCA